MVNVIDKYNKQVSVEQIKKEADKAKDISLGKKADALSMYIKSKQIDQNTIETILFDIDRLKLHYVQIDDKHGTSDIEHEVVIPYFIDTIIQLNRLLQSYTNGQVIVQQINPVSINSWAYDKLSEADAVKVYRITHKIDTLDLTGLQLRDDYDNLNEEICIDQPSNSLFDCLVNQEKFEIAKLIINNNTIQNRTNIEYLFQCMTVNKIDFGDADLDKYTSWEGLFYGSALKTLDLTSFKGNKVRQLKSTFKNLKCTGELDIQTLYFNSLRDMDGAFANANINHNIVLHRHNIETIRRNKGLYDEEPDFCMYQTFYNVNTKILDLTDFNMYLVRDMDSAFSHCEAEEVKLGHQELPFVSSLQDCFSDCIIQKIDINNLSIPYATVTSMGNMFYRSKIPEVVLSKINTDGLLDMEGFLYQAMIKTFDMRNISTSNVMIMKDIFNNCNFKIVVTDGRTLGFKSIEAYKKATIDELNSIVRKKYGLNIDDSDTRVCYAQLDTQKLQDAMQFVGSLTCDQGVLKVFDFSYNDTSNVTLNWNFVDMNNAYYHSMITLKVRNRDGKVRHTGYQLSDREWQRISDRIADKDNSKDVEIPEDFERKLLERE